MHRCLFIVTLFPVGNYWFGFGIRLSFLEINCMINPNHANRSSAILLEIYPAIASL